MAREDSSIPGWVRAACRTWGSQKRRAWSGQDWHGNVDGYASSLIGRIRDERDGAGQGHRVQHWAEVFAGDGLAVHRALIGVGLDLHDALHLKYVWDPRFNLRAEQKARLLEISERTFLANAKLAETWVQARLDTGAQSQVIDVSQKIRAQPLKSALKAAHHPVHLIKAPELSLAALKRTTLSLK